MNHITNNSTVKFLSRIATSDFYFENETDVTQIGLYYDGNTNLYFLFISPSSLNLFMIRFNINEAKWYLNKLEKFTQKSDRYQAVAAFSNQDKIIWYILTDELKIKLEIFHKDFKVEINRYTGNHLYRRSTLFLIDGLPCSIGGGDDKQKSFTYQDSYYADNFIQYARENPFVCKLLDHLYLLGGNLDNANLVEHIKLPNYHSVDKNTSSSYNRDWEKVQYYSERSTFDSSFDLKLNVLTDTACVVKTKINLFRPDSFVNNYFYSYDVLTNTWANRRIVSNIANLPLKEEKVSFKAINIGDHIYIASFDKLNDEGLKISLFNLL
ncbi:hypothetical protein RVIR1_09070 [Candidatus Rickettsiella viridis]|uniref:Uncharacterized protein n=1 Tax=Candidatus Rickettsiella viridis TaxID=676208 RepID=A0A2Z5V7I5_9COXI|nr:hypothetical protein [Candidatus Rickettsiella viridis]BBB15387.1 hypothetical protein RVIR1_09070 [Candidatus Rickettsiella viridis]